MAIAPKARTGNNATKNKVKSNVTKTRAKVTQREKIKSDATKVRSKVNTGKGTPMKRK